MQSIKNTRLLKALRCEPVDQVPIWLMRQAGRYLPEYRKVRQKAGSFLGLCKNPDFCSEVALQPIERYQLDAAILFSDILTVPHAMGLPLNFVAQEGPVFEQTVSSLKEVDALKIVDPECELRYVMDAVRAIKAALKNEVPLIGFAGSPWTVAAYMVEGKGSKTFNTLRALMYREPKTMHALLDKVTQVTIDYLKAQVAAGCDVVQVFDTWGGLLGFDTYPEFSLQYMQRIVTALMPTPIILFTKGGGLWLPQMAATGAHGLGIDWTIAPDMARKLVGERVCLQGNLDPAALYGADELIAQKVAHLKNTLGKQNGWIFNLGHGLYPDLAPEKVGFLVDCMRAKHCD